MTSDEFWSVLHSQPAVQTVFYRLYYDEQGCPLFYSMEDCPGTYIEIDQETYACSPSKVRVRNGKLVQLEWYTAKKLTPADSGTQCHTQNVSIVVDDHGQYWKKKTYESN